MEWPPWWGWTLQLTAHLRKRMADRSFTEVDLRGMLQVAHGYRPDVVDDRWVIETRHKSGAWEVIVEPDPAAENLVVVTAYPVEG